MKNKFKNLKSKLNKKYSKRPKTYTRFIVSILIVLMILINVFLKSFGMDFIVITLLILAFIKGESSKFIRDWSIPVALFYLYEAVRAQAYAMVGKVIWKDQPITEPLIWLERKIFFFLDDVPPVELQLALRPDKTIAHWYDPMLFFFYSMFFWYWLAIGFVIWVKKREVFKPYMYGLVAFSLIDVVIYAFLPTRPPWSAANEGYIPQIYRVLWEIDLLPSSSLSKVSTYGVNDYAALPSHHAAWPFYATLFLVNLYGKKALPMFIVPFVIAFATWYGAEHYVIDSLAGFLVAGITYVVAIRWNNKRQTNK